MKKANFLIERIAEPENLRLAFWKASRGKIGKGTYAALDRAKTFQKKYTWFLKLDIRKYFYSISHDVLKQQMQNLFKEKRLLKIFNTIIDSYNATNNCQLSIVNCQLKKGVPIGNLSSQYFANHYLSFADRYVKEYLHIPAYVRYMDDMVLWANCKTLLLSAGKRLKQYIEEILLLDIKPFCLNQTDKGLPFLGYLLYPYTIRLGRVSRQRFCTKFADYTRKLNKETWSQEEYQRHVLPLLAFTQYADTKEWRKKILYGIVNK